MDMIPQILFGNVMHKRLFPKVNSFTYGMYYIAVPLSGIDHLPMPVDRFGPLSLYRKDHGARDGSDPGLWIKKHLTQANIEVDGEIMLVTMPRVLGYVFNPVSFWLCFDKDHNLKAVLCEVNNTFGETHSYICARADRAVITGDDILYGEKFFHVSPFLHREGGYQFRFAVREKGLGIWIDHTDATGRVQLLTAVTGKLEPMTRQSLRRAFWRYPLITVKAIVLIHWQAFRLILKGIRYVPKPAQKNERSTSVHNIKKM